MRRSVYKGSGCIVIQSSKLSEYKDSIRGIASCPLLPAGVGRRFVATSPSGSFGSARLRVREVHNLRSPSGSLITVPGRMHLPH